MTPGPPVPGENDLLTLNEAAERLGVHYMTVYRHVRTGRLPAHKVGAEWRVAAAEVEARRASRGVSDDGARRAGGAPGPQGRRSGAAGAGRRPSAGGERHPRDDHRRLEARLMAGDEAGAWAILEDAMAAGVDPGGLYVDVMSPAMAAIGEGWAAGQVTVAQEHRASVVMLRLIGRLGPRFNRPGRKRGSVVVGAAPGDHHGVPVAMAADMLRGAGFTVVDLGADSPAESFIDAGRDAERLIAVGINATSADNDDAIAATITEVKAALGCPVVLGGQGVADVASGLALGADHVTTTAAEAVAVLDELAASGRR